MRGSSIDSLTLRLSRYQAATWRSRREVFFSLLMGQSSVQGVLVLTYPETQPDCVGSAKVGTRTELGNGNQE